jgi:glucose/arabinose dehydrogenase
MRFQTVTAIVLLIAAPACKKSPPSPSPGPGGVETIRGTERLGWDQRAADTAELTAFKYAIYVDGVRSELGEVACGSSAGANGFACSGRLPPMSPGEHSLELATFIVEGGNMIESSRSAALRVNVTASTADASAQPLRPGDAGSTSDGVPLRLDVIFEGLEEPSDIAFAPDGRLFIAERSGRLRTVNQHARLQSVSDVDGGLLAIALDPDFPSTRFIYVAQTEPGEKDGGGETFTIARYRELNGALGERIVLLHGVGARRDRAAAALSIAPDGKLYVALDDGGTVEHAGDPSTLNGKLIRVNRDGTTPDDQAAGTPVQGAGYRSPRALGFDRDVARNAQETAEAGRRDNAAESAVLWIVDGAPRSPERLSAVVATSVRPHRSEVKASYALAQNTDPSDVVVYRGDLFKSFRGNVLVAAGNGGHILRVRLDPRSPTRVIATEKLLEGVGPIRALAVAPDGSIYFASQTSIGRLTPGKP